MQKTPTATMEKYTKLADLRPYMKGVNVVFIVLEKGQVTKTKDNNIMAHAWVADSSASMNLSVWDTEADWMQPGDIFRLRGAYATLFKDQLILYAGRYGTLERIGEFTMLFVESPNMSTMKWVNNPTSPGDWNPVPNQEATQ